MSSIYKTYIAVPKEMLDQLTEIERLTDRPRTRVIRRAITDYIDRFREGNPEFATKFPKQEEI